VRRFVSLAVLLFFSIPFGLSVVGCGHKAAPVVYCNASDSGPVLGQVASITLSPTLATIGESLNYAQIGQALSATAQDCKGNTVSVSKFTFASTSSYSGVASTSVFADINPTNGQVCGGVWNHNTGGGIPDYTTCAAPVNPSGYLAFVTATASGAVSNAIPVYVHPVVTGVVLGPATGNCSTSTDPGTDCCTNTATTGPPPVAPVYTSASGCLSQGQTGQLIGRVYANGGTLPADNITCQVGHLTFSALNAPNIVSIDENGIATANQPGSSIITASVAQSATASEAGFFSTCPPKSIVLTVAGQAAPPTAPISVSLNNTQPLTATVLDTKGNPINGLSLEFNSTTPQTIPAGNGSITPVFPGAGTITAVCQPGTCNPSPFSQIGYNGNGEPLTSNGIDVTTAGTSGTVIYMGSTGSQYILPRDFTTTTPSSLIKLPYVPNSMVISQDGTEIYLGSPQGIMSIATASNAQTAANQNVPGKVLSVSPSGALVVVTDPVRQTISLYSPSASGISTSYGGIATSAQWSPDSNTVYITTTTNTLLTYSTFTNWQPTATAEPYTDVAVLVPSVGAYFAGGSAGIPTGLTDGRSYCSSANSITAGNPPTYNNTFAPLADENATVVDQIATTNDGKHLLGAHATSATSGPATFTDFDLTIPVTAQCTGTVPPGYFQSSPFTQTLTGITPSSITGIVPTSNSSLAFVTYSLAGSTGGGTLPFYSVPSSGAGTLNYLTLGNGATVASAPLSGVVSTDNLSLYVGTSGDDQVHVISLAGNSPAETSVITPNLPASSGTGYAPINLLVQHPKKTTD
jgi:hypothetical protein